MLLELLEALDVQPVLLDIGASGAPPSRWKPIASHSTYVAFDPDSREFGEDVPVTFKRTNIVPKAVVTDPAQSEVTFFLTRSPFCSSSLKPDHESLSDFLFADLFTVVDTVTVPSCTLDSILEELNLNRVDWFKSDSQGTDLRLFNSLAPQIRSRVLALDIEPGLIDAYVGEDLFSDAHAQLIRQGFWLSHLEVRGTVRMKKTVGDQIQASDGVSAQLLQGGVKKTPGWVEARYLRTPQWLDSLHAAPDEYALLWVFAVLDGQLGFALDLASEYGTKFGCDGIENVLRQYPLSRLRRKGRLMGAKNFATRVKHKIERVLT